PIRVGTVEEWKCFLRRRKSLRLGNSVAEAVACVCGCCRRKIFVSRDQCEQIDENIIIFLRFIMQIIAANAEIERPAEVGCQTQFLAYLPGVLLAQILTDKPIRTTQL